MESRESGQIWDTPSGTPLISGVKNYQYGGISWVMIKPQGSIPQPKSLHVNNMSSIYTDIPLYALYKDVIKEPPQKQQDKDTDTNTYTYIFEEENYTEEILKFAETFRQKHHGYSRKIQSICEFSKNNILDVSSSIDIFSHFTNSTTNGQGCLYMDECVNTSIFP